MKPNRKDILVSVDFGEQSIEAVKQTKKLALFLKAKVTLLHVLETQGSFISRFFVKDPDELKRAEAAVQEKLAKLAEEHYKGDGIDYQVKVLQGKPYEKVLSLSNDLKARFIIIGKNENLHSDKTILGANALHVIEEARVPVICISGKEHKLGYENLLVPLDLTKQTREQVFNALAFGLHYNAHVSLVSVLVGGVKARKSRIYKKLKRTQQTLMENGVSSSIKLFERTEGVQPYQRVVEYAAEENVDLILLMTHQETQTNDNYIGAFAQNIINESNIPVLSLTSAAAREDEEPLMKTLIDPLGVLSATQERRRFVRFKKHF